MYFCVLVLVVFVSSRYTQDKIGINFEFLHSRSNEIVFADISLHGYDGFFYTETEVWESVNDLVDVDSISFTSTGFPVEVPIQNALNTSGQPFENPLMPSTYISPFNNGGHYYSGTYTLILTGSGSVTLSGDVVEQSYDAPGTYSVEVTASDGGVIMDIETSLISDPISRVQFIIPDHTEEDTFNRYFLELYDGYYALRMKDLQQIDSSLVVDWSDLTSKEYRVQGRASGISYEYILDLANALQSPPWLCIPHLATDEFVESFAQLVKNNLDPELHFFIELSNEVFNPDPDYQQHYYADAQPGGWEFFVANRSLRVFQIFEQEFVSTEERSRFNKLLGGFSVDVSILETITYHFSGENNEWFPGDTNPTRFDDRLFLTIAHYFGYDIPFDLESEGIIDSVTYDEIFERLNVSVQETLRDWRIHRDLADSLGVGLVSYEGGSDTTLRASLQHLENLEERMSETNRMDDMRVLYEYLYRNLISMNHEEGFFNHYSGVRIYDEMSNYGMCEYMEDDLETTCNMYPKVKALRKMISDYSTCFGVHKDSTASVCSGNGRCVSFDVCDCDEGFGGDECDEEAVWSEGFEIISSMFFFLM